jgi:hypothetical protein
MGEEQHAAVRGVAEAAMRRLEHYILVFVVVTVAAPLLLQVLHAALPSVLSILAVLWLARMLWPLR